MAELSDELLVSLAPTLPPKLQDPADFGVLLGDWSSEFRVWGLGFGVWGSGFRV